MQKILMLQCWCMTYYNKIINIQEQLEVYGNIIKMSQKITQLILIQDNAKLLEQWKSGIKIIIS